MSVDVLTFGCRLNAFESEVIAREAERAGLSDTVVINSCAVTNEAVAQARQSIRRLKRERPGTRIVVTGCAAQTDRFQPALPCPTYPEIPLALARPREIARLIEAAGPAFVHIATEGPLGIMARRHCVARKRPFTSSYHTKFPEYLSARVPVPQSWGYAFMRWFHNGGAAAWWRPPRSATTSRGVALERLLFWSRGVDHTCSGRDRAPISACRGRSSCRVGRVAVEKPRGFPEARSPGLESRGRRWTGSRGALRAPIHKRISSARCRPGS